VAWPPKYSKQRGYVQNSPNKRVIAISQWAVKTNAKEAEKNAKDAKEPCDTALHLL
jgi:hypothetical protein